MTLEPLMQSSLMIQMHTYAAILATALGAFVLVRRKGTRLHKLFGRVWVVLMLVVATSAFFINEIRLIGPFSPIHLFSLLTYSGIAQALFAIRRGNVAEHRAGMVTVFVSALMLAGAFTLLPGRRMHAVLFGYEAGWTPSLIGIGIALAVAALIYFRMIPRKRLRRAG
ncbi:membrane protein [Devosia pacifica]|uniref:Membrane protein n=1 Tax=Devosia pacifica TaxID=1335967 RepID=A0A918S5E8_9HYPH|nr:DUF2306 domain-containing protein [Devosia pacifica]GHA21252.1 membrane protein [Devosia pacifica]